MGQYDEHDWEELPADIKKAAEVLGYTADKWDNDKTPEICEEDWEDLTADQKAAAIKLGYNEKKWDADESDSE